MRAFRFGSSAIALAVALSACGGGSSSQVGASADTSVPTDLATRGGLVATASSRAAMVPGGNGLANPGFESGMTSWADWGNVQVIDGAGASGTWRALRVGTAGGGTGQAVTNITPGTTYRLSGLARVTDPSETVVVGVNMLEDRKSVV